VIALLLHPVSYSDKNATVARRPRSREQIFRHSSKYLATPSPPAAASPRCCAAATCQPPVYAIRVANEYRRNSCDVVERRGASTSKNASASAHPACDVTGAAPTIRCDACQRSAPSLERSLARNLSPGLLSGNKLRETNYGSCGWQRMMIGDSVLEDHRDLCSREGRAAPRVGRRSGAISAGHPARATEGEGETGRTEGRFRNNARARRRRVYFYRAIEGRSIDSLQARRKDPAASERESENGRERERE